MMTGEHTQLVDFHCHLDLYPDLAAAISHRERERCFTLAVTTTPKAFARNRELTEPTRYVRAALGLHPQLVADRAHELPLWTELLPQTRYVGEVGLDAGPRFYRSFDQQREVFSKILKACASARGKILSVHSVRSGKTVLDMIEAHLPPTHGRVVLHWFTGSASDARRAVDMGCFFSINNVMLKNDRGRKLIGSLPTDRLLTETDGPFTDDEAGRKDPPDVSTVCDGLASVVEIDVEAMSELLTLNLKQLLEYDRHL